VAKRYQGGILGAGFNPLQAPNAPTVGALAIASGTSVTVAVTPSSNSGGAPVSNYVVISCPGAINGSSASSPVTVSGLTTGTAYTFRATALNSYGPSPISAASSSITPIVQGQQAYTTAGTFSWVAPAGVTSVSVVTVGGGASNSSGGGTAYGGGGALAYKNNIAVTPGNSYTVVVGAGASRCTGGANGGNSYFNSTGTVWAQGGLITGAATYVGDGGGNGGGIGQGGGGAGGYSGNGGTGGFTNCNSGSSGSGGGGGGGGARNGSSCYQGGAGGGVGILGAGSSGAGSSRGIGGGAGSGGSAGQNGFIQCCTGFGGNGGAYGGGGGAGRCGTYTNQGGAGAGGAVRIIYPGTTRSFPSTNTGNL